MTATNTTSTAAQPIEVTIMVTITHYSGPVVADADHVRRWLCADGQALEGRYDGFTYEVCPNCSDPDTCECDDTPARYLASIVSADWED